MSKKKILLVESEKMNENSGRNEDGLIRMSSLTRESLGFKTETIEVWTSSSELPHVLLKVYIAYADDLKDIKNKVKRGELKSADTVRIGFVTKKMLNRITDSDLSRTIWASDEPVEETLIGADPEFLLFGAEGEVIAANRVIPKEGLVGSDGAMAELRPKPATNPEDFIENIGRLLKDKNLTAKIQPYEWKAACYHRDKQRDYGVGGHIHIGNPTRVNQLPMEKRELFFNVLNKILDELLSVPMTKLDGELGTRRRTQCSMSNGHGGWGYFGEWRTANGRLEHRTLSGLWLTSPHLAKCVIGTAKAITDEAFALWGQADHSEDFIKPPKHADIKKTTFYNHNFNKWCDVPICKELGTIKSTAEMKNILNESKPSVINKTFLNSWLDSMKKLSTYPKYEKYILGLKLILEKSLKQFQDENKNLKDNWVDS